MHHLRPSVRSYEQLSCPKLQSHSSGPQEFLPHLEEGTGPLETRYRPLRKTTGSDPPRTPIMIVDHSSSIRSLGRHAPYRVVLLICRNVIVITILNLWNSIPYKTRDGVSQVWWVKVILIQRIRHVNTNFIMDRISHWHF